METNSLTPSDRENRYAEMQHDPSSVTKDDLNNMHLYMPRGGHRTQLQNSEDLQRILHKKFAAIFCEDPHAHEKHSPIKLDQTPMEFINTIDEVLEKMNLKDSIIELREKALGNPRNTEEYKRLEEEFYQLSKSDPANLDKNIQTAKCEIIEKIAQLQKNSIDAFNLALLKVYQELRKRGYSHLDLTA